ncbi:MAG: hypothetical protein KJO91_08995, partial [Gammaproteobacteria bacterium]|nr:hypothetical protein [Gammaproteobacteria bacterium]
LLLGLSDEPVEHENLLIMDKGPDSVGILIDDLPLPFDMSKGAEISQIPELPAGLSNCISDAYTVDDVIWLGFKHKDFFHSVMDSVASN